MKLSEGNFVRPFTPPMNEVDIRKLSIEGLAMLYFFLPNYFNEPEGGLVSAARQELARRGAIKLHNNGNRVEWLIDEETTEELWDNWHADGALERFGTVVGL
jgi:hypothetical protein